jgi:hypothetical protein
LWERLEDMDEAVEIPQDLRELVEKIKTLTRTQAERLLTEVIG